MSAIDTFRAETRAWLEENCPAGARGPGPIATGSTRIKIESKDTVLWLERMAEKGWTAPGWPAAYGGGGLGAGEHRVLAEEMARIDARPPLVGMGTSMIGPTLLEYGTEEQKQRHLPRIARGEAAWCQGYSEPGAGSDLASLRTRADDHGDHFLVNGQKIWTSGAQVADWMFALVRTDFDAAKHDGISFVLLDMHQDGVTVKPIRLISGNSPFCETFFDNAVVQKDDLVGELNKGWTVGKRLLQHERAGQGGLAPGGRRRGGGIAGAAATPLPALARQHAGDGDGRIADPVVREEVLRHEMQTRALRLTQRRAVEENADGRTVAEATSIFKLVGATLTRDRTDLVVRLMGTRGLGWDGDAFDPTELEATRSWLSSRAVTIFGGTNEIQMNIIAKRVLGLPD